MNFFAFLRWRKITLHSIPLCKIPTLSWNYRQNCRCRQRQMLICISRHTKKSTTYTTPRENHIIFVSCFNIFCPLFFSQRMDAVAAFFFWNEFFSKVSFEITILETIQVFQCAFRNVISLTNEVRGNKVVFPFVYIWHRFTSFLVL